MPSMSPRIRRPSAPMVVALLALFIALGGPASAARLINGSDIKKGTVGSKQLADRSVKQRDLSRGTVAALTAVPAGAVGPAQLAGNAVGTSALAPGSVLTGNVADGTLTAADLGTGSVGPDEIAENAIGQTQIRPNGVAASEISDGSIDGREIVDGGLGVRDVARQVGTFEWTIPDLAPEQCARKWYAARGVDLAGAFLLVSPTAAWPNALVYDANMINSETMFKVQACNRGEEPVPSATYPFNYAVLGP